MNNSIFREYDIRGIAGKDLNHEVVEMIGLSFGSMIIENGLKKISIGRDCRKSSDWIFDSLSKGIIRTGVDIIDLGLVTTPVLYFSLYGLDVDGGIMITASHNPPNYNGFKAAIGKDVLSSKQIQDLKDKIIGRSFRISETKGQIVKFDIYELYMADIVKNIKISRKLRVGVDCANTPVGLFAKDVLTSAGCEVFELFPEPDGNFPNHHPDPSVEDNLRDLINLVKEEKLDIGIAFDGDADRLGVINEKGVLIYSDMILLLLARSVVKENPGAKIIGEVKCSKNLFDDIRRNGGIPIMWKTGHSNIKRKIKEEKAPLAGELSGHIFFSDRHHGYDDALYAALRLIEIISNQKDSISNMLKDIPKMYSTPEIRIDFAENEKFVIVDKLIQSIKDENLGLYNLVTVDGIRLENSSGWALVRASNTQPALTIRFEAESEEKLKDMKNYISKKLTSITGVICIS
ncbi:MAG TPA: phosphomannomutase/phosphoglucomutase [Candidatus Dadabacteria bacterium]|nr:phosphomannomutase/phosphoglucomutase [Candidatus Dadabacteria bacterium]